jgi:tetratricopeptide (TPR) repeat protein
MDKEGKIDQFCKKLEVMAREVSGNELGLMPQFSQSGMPLLGMLYRAALGLYATDSDCLGVLERIFSMAEGQNLQQVLTEVSEDEVQILGNFAEQFIASGKVKEAIQLFQFLVLLSPGGIPNPYAYLRLAETLSLLNIDTGAQIYDFILNVFPDNPPILLSAGRCYYENERPKRALRVLTHAKEICERHCGSNPEFQELLDLVNLELGKIQGEVSTKKI